MKLCISGANGRMGRQLLQAVAAQSELSLASALYHGDCGEQQIIERELDGNGKQILITTDAYQAIAAADCLIDFTRPLATMQYLDICRQLQKKMVIGTTGFSATEQQQISAAAQKIAIVMSPNMSAGVNVALKLIEIAAAALTSDYDIEVIEAHHRHKIDAPSGTALAMGRAAATARGLLLDNCAVYDRHGNHSARTANEIGFTTVRGGDIVGDHTVMLAGSGERLEITHRAADRQIYANGSLQAAKFLAAKTTGLYDMFDVLGLN